MNPPVSDSSDTTPVSRLEKIMESFILQTQSTLASFEQRLDRMQHEPESSHSKPEGEAHPIGRLEALLESFAAQTQKNMDMLEQRMDERLNLLYGTVKRELTHTPPLAEAAQPVPTPEVASMAKHEGSWSRACEVDLFRGTLEERASDFIEQLEAFFVACMIHSDHRRVAVARTYLRDVAQSWFSNRIKELPGMAENWNYFAAELKTRFKNPHEERRARKKLSNCRQKTKNGLYGFCNEFFKILRLIPSMDVETQIFFFCEGLLPECREWVYMNNPVSIDHARELAECWDNSLDRSASRFPPSSASAPMSLNYTEKKGTGCFACGEEGHIARECQKKKDAGREDPTPGNARQH